MKADPPLVHYYGRRASEYERIYAKPERQAELQELRTWVGEFAAGHNVLELACGTGWWTEILARHAKAVTAVDLNPEMLALAREKPLKGVRFLCRDLYSSERFGASFTAGFAGFWWSHVSRTHLPDFLAGFHQRLEPGAQVMFLDNRFVPGSSTPICRTDSLGNTYQTRRLDDGQSCEVLKNFPEPAELRNVLGSNASELQIRQLTHYWCLNYRVCAHSENGGQHR